METDWSSQGVPVKSLVEQWSISLTSDSATSSTETNGRAAIASDGQYLYVHGAFGLLKVGSGYGNTKKVCVRVGVGAAVAACTICVLFISQIHYATLYPGICI